VTARLLSCAAALLDQGRIVDRLSRPLTAAALIGMMLSAFVPAPPTWLFFAWMMLVLLAGLVETYLAIRVGFDAGIFRNVAAEAADFSATDTALIRLGLLPAEKAGRPADVRIAGARRLLGLQVAALAAQVIIVVVGTMVGLAWR
jgi:hypothetical protein